MTHSGLIIDTHAHIYPAYDVSRFFNSAVQHLKHLAPSAYRAIVLTERVQENFFSALKERTITGDFSILDTSESTSIDIRISSGKHLAVIAGKQVNSYEGLEVLALGASQPVPDRNPLRDTLTFIREHGGVPVIPWSFGKWVGKRKKVLMDLLASSDPKDFLLGDIIGHGGFLAAQDILDHAATLGFRTVHGTDPLPMSSDETLVGRYATLLECTFDRTRPSEALKALRTNPIMSKGKKDSSLVSLKRQALLRIR